MKMKDNLDELFQISADGNSFIAKAENEEIEHKRSYSFNANVAKTCAAFANNRGGYIIFGVDNRSAKLEGLSHSNAKKFREYDLRKATQQLHRYFDPNITIDKRHGEFMGKSYGIITVYESDVKPIMSINKDDDADLDDGVIYYRYGAESKRIRSSDLQRIISDRIQKSMERIASLTQIAISRGPENIAVFDTVSGEGIGPQVQPFVIDKSALDSLDIVKEGQLSETEGAPALRLVADVTTVIDTHELDIDKERVVHAFLDQERVGNPEAFLSSITKYDVTYAPLYYFAHLAGFGMASLQDYISTVENPRKNTVQQLVKRLNRERDSAKQIIPTGFATSRNASLLEKLRRKEEIPVQAENFKMVMASILSLDTEEIDKNYILDIARGLYRHMASMDTPYPTVVRKLICYLDRVLYPLSE